MTRLNPDNRQKEACDIIGCKYDQLMKLVRLGELDGTYYKIGRRAFFVREKLEEWIENQIERQSVQHESGLRMAR